MHSAALGAWTFTKNFMAGLRWQQANAHLAEDPEHEQGESARTLMAYGQMFQASRVAILSAL